MSLFHLSIRVPKTVKRKLEKIARYEGHDSTSLVARTALGQYVLNHPVCGTVKPMAQTTHRNTGLQQGAVRLP